MGKHNKAEPPVDPWKVLIESSSTSNSDSNSTKKVAVLEPKPKKSKKDRKESASSEKSDKSKKRKRDREDSATSSKSKSSKSKSSKKNKKSKDDSSDEEAEDEARPSVPVPGSVKRACQESGQVRMSDQPAESQGQGVSFFELLAEEREAEKIKEAKAAERKARKAELEAQEVEALLLERAARKKRKEVRKAEKAAKKEQDKKEKKEKKRKDRESAAEAEATPDTELKGPEAGLGMEEKDNKKKSSSSSRPVLPRATTHTASAGHVPTVSSRPEPKGMVSNGASTAKVPATHQQPAKGAEVLEKWNVGGLEGGSQRQSKFARLLGAKKQGIAVDSAAAKASSKNGLEQVTNDLEKQFEYGRKMKHESGGQKKGLGA